MAWPAQIEAWRQIAEIEGEDLPVDLLLAVIQAESGGEAGVKSRQTTHPATVGGKKLQNAYGLMQVTPRLIAAWNSQVKDPVVTLADLEGTDERAARVQVRIGASYLRNQFARLANYSPTFLNDPMAASLDQTALALAAYRMGWYGLRQKLDELQAVGQPLTWRTIAERWPTWGTVNGSQPNKPIYYVDRVMRAYLAQGEPQPQIATTPSRAPELAAAAQGNLFPIFAVVLAFAAAYLRSKGYVLWS
jgi:hypothetical protein